MKLSMFGANWPTTYKKDIEKYNAVVNNETGTNRADSCLFCMLHIKQSMSENGGPASVKLSFKTVYLSIYIYIYI